MEDGVEEVSSSLDLSNFAGAEANFSTQELDRLLQSSQSQSAGASNVGEEAFNDILLDGSKDDGALEHKADDALADGAKKYLMYSYTEVDGVTPDVPSTDAESMVQEGGTDRVTPDPPRAGQKLTVEEDGTDLKDVNRFRRGHVVIDRDWLMCHEARKFKHRLVMYDDGTETLELRLPRNSAVQTLGVFTCGEQSYAPDDEIGRFVGSLLRQGPKDIVDQHPLYKEYGMEAEVDDTVYHVVPGRNYAFGLMHFVNGADYDAGDGPGPNVTAKVEHGVDDNKVSIIFKALVDIGPETELLVNYGSEYYEDRLTEKDLELTKDCIYYGPDNKLDVCDKEFYYARDFDKPWHTLAWRKAKIQDDELREYLDQVVELGCSRDNHWARIEREMVDESPMRSPFFLAAHQDLNEVIVATEPKNIQAIIENPSMTGRLMCKFATFVALVNHRQNHNYSPGLANVLYKVYTKALDMSSTGDDVAQRWFVHYKLGLVVFSMAYGTLQTEDETVGPEVTLTKKLCEMAKRHLAQALDLYPSKGEVAIQIEKCQNYMNSVEVEDLRNDSPKVDRVKNYNQKGMTFKEEVTKPDKSDSKRKKSASTGSEQLKRTRSNLVTDLLQELRF